MVRSIREKVQSKEEGSPARDVGPAFLHGLLLRGDHLGLGCTHSRGCLPIRLLYICVAVNISWQMGSKYLRTSVLKGDI